MADYQYLTVDGVIVEDTADTLALVEQEYRTAFGQSLNVKQGPQQVLIAAEVSARQAATRNNAALANQINPNIAGGVFLDAIWGLTGGTRSAASKSVIPGVAVTGQPGTLIPAGSQAQTAASDVFASASDVTLDALGAGSVDFIAVEYGPVPANAGTLTAIVSGVLGWETVTNATAATLGTDEETDVASRTRRRNTLALQGVALPEAIISALYDTAGVKSLKFRENKDDIAAVIDTINMNPHSIYVCVDGGTDADVAATLLAKKSLGGDWNGTTTVNVTDPSSGQVYPVKFSRPTPAPVLARVYVRNVNAVGDPVTLTQDAILAYTSGQLDGEAGFTVGNPVSPFELAGAVNRTSPGLYVQKVEVTLAAVVNYLPVEVPITIDKIATINAASITVVQV